MTPTKEVVDTLSIYEEHVQLNNNRQPNLNMHKNLKKQFS